MRLEFVPFLDRDLEVRYARKKRWSFRSERVGQLEVDLVLRWQFQKHGDKRWLAIGSFESVRYSSRGRIDDFRWDHNVEWSKKHGYRRGKGHAVDRQWVEPAIARGLRFFVDNRGACIPPSKQPDLGNRHGLHASAMLGFGATLPGKRVVVGNSWQWKSRHVDVGKGHDHVATSRLAALLDRGLRARVECSVTVPELGPIRAAESSLVYLVNKNVPRTSTYERSRDLQRLQVHTTARWLPRPVTRRAAKK